VDSAEADQVGSQRFRFCAYVGLTIDEGVRHYRTTPGAFFPALPFVWLFIAGCGSYGTAGHHRSAGTIYFGSVGRSAMSSDLAGHCGLVASLAIAVALG
jgi:hypothetical protein